MLREDQPMYKSREDARQNDGLETSNGNITSRAREGLGIRTTKIITYQMTPSDLARATNAPVI